MKKTYMIPTTIVVKLRLTKMVAASEYLPISEEVDTASGAESRRRGNSVWDDDDDDFDY